ncbi:MAG TPA: HlyD family secretion protein [Opitutaceae bacterium]|jgi:membrane fusion protein (multidrug efflux system)
MSTLTATTASELDHPAFVPERPAAEAKGSARGIPWPRILTGTAIVLVLSTTIGTYLNYAAGFESTDDSYLESDVHPISARINGTVQRVLINDNDRVVAGQPLVEIDPADLSLAVQSAEGDLAQAHAGRVQADAQIERAKADVESAGARIAQNAAQLTLDELEFHRMERLVSNGAESVQALDAARATFNAAQAAQLSLVSAKDSDVAALAAAQAQRAVALAQVQKAEAALATAKLQVDYTVIRAPSAGHVAKKSVEVGQRLQPGQPVMAIVSDQVWVVANFKENQLSHLRPGEKARIRVDADQGKVFEGVVQSFSPGTGAEFSLLPPDNATGNFTKVVQRVPVKILFADEVAGEAAAHLAPGLSADVRVSVR